ncbi:MAG: hypothetical protein AAFS10_20965 [Myxococcota bacterium]
MHTASSPPHPPWTRDLAVALAGPAAIGVCLGWAFGGTAPFTMAALLPLTFVIVIAVTLPGLYVGSTLLGATIDLKTTLRTTARTGRALGVVFLGLTPALLFLSSTATDAHEAIVLGCCGALLGAGVAVRVFYAHLRSLEDGRGMIAAFIIWALISFVLGLEVYMNMLRLGGIIP